MKDQSNTNSRDIVLTPSMDNAFNAWQSGDPEAFPEFWRLLWEAGLKEKNLAFYNRFSKKFPKLKDHISETQMAGEIYISCMERTKPIENGVDGFLKYIYTLYWINIENFRPDYINKYLRGSGDDNGTESLGFHITSSYHQKKKKTGTKNPDEKVKLDARPKGKSILPYLQ